MLWSEIVFLSGIIQQGIDEEQIRSRDSTRVADGILSVSESLKFKSIHGFSDTLAPKLILLQQIAMWTILLNSFLKD